MRSLLSLLLLFPFIPAFSQSFLPGYQTKISGEDLSYHSPQPDATVSLLVRSEDSTRFIEWQSAPLTVIPSYSPTVSFLLLAGIDVNPDDPHSWKVLVNDQHYFTISSPLDTTSKTITWNGPDGSSLVFKVKEVDKYGDFMGYLYCNLPSAILETGKPVRFKVVGENAGSRTWFMVFKYETTEKVTLTAEQAVMRGKKGNSQVLRAEIVHYSDPVDVTISVAGKKIAQTLQFGHNMLYLPVPEIRETTSFTMNIKAGKEIIADKNFSVDPVIPRTIYLLHHSHNDIGYTHVQPEVEQMQWQNLETAIRLAAETKDLPEEARMKYCTEVMWAVESWYDSASTDQKEAFKKAVKEGSIELNGLFANELVSLLGPEELDRMMEAGRRISAECGVELTTAMITDIPGWSWALVPALAHSGVKYLSLGTNRGHRIGDIIEAWGDKPFYWVGPSGNEKVLCWVHGEGYSLFHTGLAYSSIRKRLQEELIFQYMDNLVKAGYPYEEVTLRYNIGSDNGPLDETLPMAVKEWNEKYVTPKIIISTVDEAFSLFESKHGKDLPEVTGDITCYWEDGAYSTARETIMNRNNANRLVQAQALWAMYNPQGYPEKDVREAWRNVLLFDEHTWGSWNSISEPNSPFTIQQWEIKKSFVAKADKQSKKLMYDAVVSKILGGPAGDKVEIINTCGWIRGGLITLSGFTPESNVMVKNSKGEEIPSQLLSDGNLAFLAKDIPPMASRIYTISQIPNSKTQDPNKSQKTTSNTENPKSNRQTDQSPNRQTDQSANRQIQTARFIVTISETGAISSLVDKKTGRELVNTSSLFGLNEYIYVAGRSPVNSSQAKLKEIEITDEGPVVTIIRIDLEAPGCKSYTTTLRIVDETGSIEVVNTLDKEKVTDPEAVHIAFPFNIPGGEMRYDLAYGHCRPEADQAPGSNKNFLAMEHWLDISADTTGVIVICPDAPLFEVGDITMDEIVYGWVDELEPTGTFYSYLMNDYWETNYAASQPGPCVSRYLIIPHSGFNSVNAEKTAIGMQQPLITRKGGGWLKEKESLLKLKNNVLVITSVKPLDQGKGLLISVYNAGTKARAPEFGNEFKAIYFSDPDGIKELPLEGNPEIAPGGNIYLKVML